MNHDWDSRYSKPPIAAGGIRSRSQHGSFGENWWAKRWISLLERFNLATRLTRGRSYARKGHVIAIDIGKGSITAQVQGSGRIPYIVTIEVATLPAEQWDTLANALSQQAIFAARLLAGEMPDDIEEVFRDTGISLLPETMQDIQTDCTCLDWANPCKHIAAVYYLLGEEFDRDPFLIFRLRGIEREQLMEKLAPATGPANSGNIHAPTLPPEELRADPALFWGSNLYPAEDTAELRTPPVPAALPRQLGPLPFWRATESLHDTLVPLYIAASTYTLGDIMPDKPAIPE